MEHSPPELSTYQFLADNPEVFVAVAEASGDALRAQKSLRARFPAEAVRLALSLTEYRRKAASRGFPHADRLWFDRVRLEQATAWPVARHKARRFSGIVQDACCGAGMDAIALAERAEVVATDIDPLACFIAKRNAEIFGAGSKITIRTQAAEELTSREGLLHIDPDRRSGKAGRAVRLEDYVPSLEILWQRMREFAGGAIKLSPAANFGGKFENVEMELVSLYGECKEATIWFGTLAGEESWRATALPSGETIAGDPLAAEPSCAPLRQYLYDPDPALVRAGLIDLFCAERAINRLDLAEEYLTSDGYIESPFVTGFRVLAELPNNETTLKRQLRNLKAGVVEIKARRLPVPIERLQKKLPRAGSRPLVVFFCRIADRARIVIAERVNSLGFQEH